MTKLTALITTALALPIVALSVPTAALNGATGTNEFFGVANVTADPKNNDYLDQATVLACGDTMEYALIIDNASGPAPMEWQVGVTLPKSAGAGIVSTAELATSHAANTGMVASESVLVNMIPDSRLSYIEDKTELFIFSQTAPVVEGDVDGSFINGTFTAGEPLAVGETGYLFFQAEVICDDDGTPAGPGVDTPTKNADINAPITSTTNNKPTMLVKTGPSSVAGLLVLVAAAGAAAYNFVLRRQNAR